MKKVLTTEESCAIIIAEVEIIQLKLKKINKVINKEKEVTTNYYLLASTASQMQTERLNEAAASRLASLAQKAMNLARKTGR